MRARQTILVAAILLLARSVFAAPTIFVNDEIGFDAQVLAQSLALAGTEDWESSTLPPNTLTVIPDLIQPGVPHMFLPGGTNPATGMTVQTNTNSSGGNDLSPRLGDSLAISSPPFQGTPTDQLSTAFGVDGLDLLFNPGVMAVSLTPLFVDLNNTRR